ncbi:transcriptional regulator, LacI family [Paenibacillus sp. 1_12]|uniref:LacI family DNA-binding transcriptional regulator n=1 Tax=Paenibacillus sp. 1_12 TaxID=1566278 RepID=UPI0008EF9E22|nr:LacI family DNA-binding transcriptional regulator [Paenibacillus sp. 1_12]SFK74181.1 transcriptional regulator, LacI family [Paenibacillus sp. 1_12]
MSKPVTIYDIAKMVNASTATVSRVLSNSTYPVSAEMSKKIKAVAKELNYTPNMLGKQLKTNNSMTIGVIIPSISNPFYADVVLGIEEIARKNGYHVLLCNSHQNPELEAEYLQTLLEKQVKGLIVSSISKNKDFLDSYLEKGLCVISIDQYIDNPDVYQIGFDYRKGAYLACKYLIEQGHTNIAYVTAILDRPSRLGLFHGYHDALRESGIEPLDLWILEAEEGLENTYSSAFEFNIGKQLAHRLMKLDKRPTAIMTCNDLTAFGVISELKEQGIDVPGQISVVGFDNIEFSQMSNPALTTVDLPKYEMGKFSCNMLMDILVGKTIDVKEIVLQPKLIIRQSVMQN